MDDLTNLIVVKIVLLIERTENIQNMPVMAHFYKLRTPEVSEFES